MKTCGFNDLQIEQELFFLRNNPKLFSPIACRYYNTAEY